LLLLFAVTATVSPAQTFTTLYNFNGKHGAYPTATLIQGTDGNLYGTTQSGGASSSCNIGAVPGCGTVFKINPTGRLETVHSFDSTDGSNPYAGLVQTADGNLYGTTSGGGANGYGTVFEITPSGTLTTLHSFDGRYGASPYGGLVQAAGGDFYGTTSGVGAHNAGTVFRITPDGALTTLHSFHVTDGARPYAGLVQGASGDFYGTTLFGGGVVGTVFKITPSGTLTTLQIFGTLDGLAGAHPSAGLVQAASGDFYGTARFGGEHSHGTVFKITAGGMLTPLHSFGGGDSANPDAGLVLATDGNLYGTTYGGGGGFGTVFKITPSGTLTTLHSFDGTHGANPYAGLVEATDGNLYGATEAGGYYGDGTIFSLDVGLRPFVETQTTSGKVGAAVEILGNKLTGATSVEFNGTAAVFTVVSSSLITTTVPTGATTGFVTVTSPLGTLKSNKRFRVTP
jgi:uncharacterized repeat protein (TIGR03803 family)